VLLLGRAHGTIRPGRVIDASQSQHRELNGLFLALMHRMGLRNESFGDAEQPFEEIA